MRITRPLLLACALLPATAFAGSLECSDTIGQRMHYRYEQTDGGAPLPPQERLVLDDQLLIETSLAIDVPETRTATFELADPARRTLKIARSSDGDYRMRMFTAHVVLRALGDETTAPDTVLYDDLVTCKSSQYVGLPRP